MKAMTDRQSTHGPDCWGWGPKHYECAVAEIRRLREQLRLAVIDQAIAEAEANDVRRNAGVLVPPEGYALVSVEALRDAAIQRTTAQKEPQQ